MKNNILLLGDYIVDEFLKDLCEINSDYKVSHIYVLNINPNHQKLIKQKNIEVIRGWHDFNSLIHKEFRTDILLDPVIRENAYHIINNFFRFTNTHDFFYNEAVYYELVNYWIHFFEKNNINTIICENPSYLEPVTIMVAEKIFGLRVISRKLLSRLPKDNSFRMSLFDSKKNKYIPLKIDKKFIIESILFPDYSKLKFKKIPKIIVEIVKSITNFKFSNMLFIFSSLIKFSETKRGIKKLLFKPDLNKKFIYYPLHFDPEVATHPTEEVRANQALNIKKLASNLPKDWVIYVKVHPTQFKFKINFWVWEFFGNTMRYFFDLERLNYISRIPNVILIDQSVNQETLINKSESIASIGGTVFLEASYHNKPILVFGKQTLYKQLNNAFFIESQNDIKNAIHKIVKKDFLESNVESVFRDYTYHSKEESKLVVIQNLINYLSTT